MTLAPPASLELDSELFDYLTVVERQTRYPRDTRAFVRIDTCHRLYWHTLFDICPKALELDKPDGLSIFRPFMAWAAQQGISFDWTYYLWVYNWLLQSDFRDKLTEDLLIEMVGASTGRWANLNRGDDCGIVVGSANCPKLVVAWKARTVDGAREVELIRLAEPLPPPPEQFGYFTLPRFELDHFPGWRPIPR